MAHLIERLLDRSVLYLKINNMFLNNEIHIRNNVNSNFSTIASKN
jgi:hypothetical protein